jgi:hypothetical protein
MLMVFFLLEMTLGLVLFHCFRAIENFATLKNGEIKLVGNKLFLPTSHATNCKSTDYNLFFILTVNFFVF